MPNRKISIFYSGWAYVNDYIVCIGLIRRWVMSLKWKYALFMQSNILLSSYYLRHDKKCVFIPFYWRKKKWMKAEKTASSINVCCWSSKVDVHVFFFFFKGGINFIFFYVNMCSSIPFYDANMDMDMVTAWHAEKEKSLNSNHNLCTSFSLFYLKLITFITYCFHVIYFRCNNYFILTHHFPKFSSKIYNLCGWRLLENVLFLNFTDRKNGNDKHWKGKIAMSTFCALFEDNNSISIDD